MLDSFSKHRCLTAILALLYIIYPATSRVVVAMFACQQLPLAAPEGSTTVVSYLRADYRIRCFSPTHNRYRAPAGAVAAVVFPFGVPALFRPVAPLQIRGADSF